MAAQLSAADLEVMLALSRARTLAAAARRLGLDASTVFRALQRAEKALGQRLFERSSTGYDPTDMGLQIARHAEAIERELDAARGAGSRIVEEPAGLVRIGAVDAVLNLLLIPALAPLAARHPQLRFELHGGNDLSNLTQREVDIAVRSTQRPPGHVVGKRLGTMDFAVYAEKRWAKGRLGRAKAATLAQLAEWPWIGIDVAMPEHPGVAWRKHHLPQVLPRVQANSMVSVTEAVEAGLGAAILARFHAARRPGLAAVTPPLENCGVDLWLLTHPESRHQARIAAVARHLAQQLPPLLAGRQTASTTRPKGRSSTR